MGAIDQTDRLLREEVAVLTMIARDAPFMDTLKAIIALAERMEPLAVAGVTIVDRAERSLEMAVFTSVGQEFADAIAGVPLGPPHVGTCAQALYRGEVVTSENLAVDPRFAKEWLDLCEDHGIRSCRSHPILTSEGAPLGTFMLCFREPHKLDALDVSLINVCAKLAEMTLERRRARELQELTIGELQHRTANLFSVVGALARMTFTDASDLPRLHEVFSGRLHALATSHSMMLAVNGADLATLIHRVLAPYGHDGMIKVTGPPIGLAPAAASSLGTAMHELATNASKYGALSNNFGSIDITWDIKARPDGEPWFSFNWIESGGPTVERPTHRGFGMRMIERMLAREIEGTAQLDFAPDGLRVKIEAPFREQIGKRR